MASAAVSSEPRKSPSPCRRNAKFLIAGGVIALAVAYLIIMGLQNTTEYFLTVSELQQRGASAQNQRIRVSGDLVPGTLAEDPSGVGMHFLIADPTSTPLVVEYHGGQVPDIMGDNIEIVAEGKLDASGHLRRKLRCWPNAHPASRTRHPKSTVTGMARRRARDRRSRSVPR